MEPLIVILIGSILRPNHGKKNAGRIIWGFFLLRNSSHSLSIILGVIVD